MALQKKDREFRLTKISYLDFKYIEMDRVLTGLFERLEHSGYPSVFRDKRELTVDKFVDDIIEASNKFVGFFVGCSQELFFMLPSVASCLCLKHYPRHVV